MHAAGTDMAKGAGLAVGADKERTESTLADCAAALGWETSTMCINSVDDSISSSVAWKAAMSCVGSFCAPPSKASWTLAQGLPRTGRAACAAAPRAHLDEAHGVGQQHLLARRQRQPAGCGVERRKELVLRQHARGRQAVEQRALAWPAARAAGRRRPRGRGLAGVACAGAPALVYPTSEMTGSSTSALRSRYCFRCRRTWRARALRRAPHGARRLRRERTAGRESTVPGTAPPPPAAAAAPCAGAAAACRSQSASRPCRASARPPAAPLAPHARRQAPRRLLRARRHPQARSSGPRRAHSASTCASAGAAGSPVARARPGRLARARSRAVKRGRRGRRRGLAERAHLQLPLLGLCGLREDVDDERSPVSHAAGRQLLRRPSTASASGRGSGRRCRSGAPSPSPGCAAARGSARRQRSLRTPARWSRAGSAAAQELWRQPPLRACVGLQLGQLGRQLRKLASAQVCPLQGARPVSCSPARPMRRHHK